MKTAQSTTTATTTSNAERLYYSSIASPYTQLVYRTYLRKYLAHYGMKGVSDILKKDHKEIESQIIEFIIWAKENKGMKRIAIANYTNPVISFCKINDIMLNTTKINKFMPPHIKSKKTFAYTHEQIQLLLNISDERMRCVILLASQCGLRVGAIPGLTVGSLEEYKDLYKITVYENTSDEYTVFATSELKKEILSYLSMRRRYGEVIRDSAPLIREMFDRRDQFSIAHPRRIKETALSCKLTELAEAAGLRTKVQLKEGQQPASIRSSIPKTNGFRRFYCGILADSGLLTERRWLLEGHRLLANDSSYLKITTEDLYNQFMLAHDNLLIDQSHKLRAQVQKLEIEMTEIQALALELEKVKRAMKLKTT